MTTTLETVAPMEDVEFTSSNEVASAVLDQLHALEDPSTEAHAYFYDTAGLNSAPLVESRFPSGGHTVLLQNETEHTVTLPNGDTAKVETFKRRGARSATIFAFLKNSDLLGVVTASQGGHGQGVAAAGLDFGLACKVHTPTDASLVKIAKMEVLGAKVENVHDSLAAAVQAAERTTEDNPRLAFIHPFDHIDTIAGQATVGIHMLRSLKARATAGELDLHKDPVDVVVPEGGGGLATGIAIIFKEARDRGEVGDNVRILTASVEDKEVNELCDGTRTKTGTLTSLVLHDPAYVQGHIRVSTLEVANAMYELTATYNKRIEGAGAIAYAGAQQLNRSYPTRDKYAKVTSVVPVTGANVSPETYEAAMELRKQAYDNNLHALGRLTTRTFNKPTSRSAYLRGPVLRA